MDALHLGLATHAIHFYLVNQLPFVYIVWYLSIYIVSPFYAISQRVAFQEYEGKALHLHLAMRNHSLITLKLQLAYVVTNLIAVSL
jgi:hypothetical protein